MLINLLFTAPTLSHQISSCKMCFGGGSRNDAVVIRRRTVRPRNESNSYVSRPETSSYRRDTTTRRRSTSQHRPSQSQRNPRDSQYYQERDYQYHSSTPDRDYDYLQSPPDRSSPRRSASRQRVVIQETRSSRAAY